MTKNLMQEPRFDFRGGLNTREITDSLGPNEVSVAVNARIGDRYGAIAKRGGSRRLHATSLGAAVTGLRQWDSPSGKQLVAIADGKLWHKVSEFGDFTSVSSPSGFSAARPQTFATARENAAEAPLRLYVADGTFWRWTGSALTDLTAAGGPEFDLITWHLSRMFGRHIDWPQNLWWSVIGDPEDYEVGLRDKGGQSMIGVLRGEGITALGKVGGSLLVATPNGVARFNGYSALDIQIAQDTEGIDNEVGSVGPLAFQGVERFMAMLSDRGPYAVSEGEAQAVGFTVEPEFAAMNRSDLEKTVIGYHAGHREVYWLIRESGSDGHKAILATSMGGVQGWSGPFRYPFEIRCLAKYEDPDGREHVAAGCSDGFVRLLETDDALEDVLADGSGGSTYEMLAKLAPMFFDTGPGRTKTLVRLNMRAEIAKGKRVHLGVSFDDGPVSERPVTGKGEGMQSYRVDLYGQGAVATVQIRDDSSGRMRFGGVVAEAFDMQRTLRGS